MGGGFSFHSDYVFRGSHDYRTPTTTATATLAMPKMPWWRQGVNTGTSAWDIQTERAHHVGRA